MKRALRVVVYGALLVVLVLMFSIAFPLVVFFAWLNDEDWRAEVAGMRDMIRDAAVSIWTGEPAVW